MKKSAEHYTSMKKNAKAWYKSKYTNVYRLVQKNEDIFTIKQTCKICKSMQKHTKV